MAEYEQTVLRALEETENAFVSYCEQQQRLVKLNEQARESARASAIARARYREGVADFLALLDAERTQLEAENAVAQAESQVFTSVVAVYKALGGIDVQRTAAVPAADDAGVPRLRTGGGATPPTSASGDAGGPLRTNGGIE
jgi:outer membrane protein TolC